MFVARSETLAVDMMNVDGAETSAMRRRQRRLRAMLRHERQTVAMELAAALHHSRDARSNDVPEPDNNILGEVSRPTGILITRKTPQQLLEQWHFLSQRGPEHVLET